MMRLTRLYDPQQLSIHQEVQLSEFAAKHIALVLRGEVGDKIILFNGKGGEYRAVISTIKKQKVTATILQFKPHECESFLSIQLAQAISRSDKMDYTLQKATELGVTSITPLMTERSGVKLNAERFEKRCHHWQGVISSACEQCGRNRLPILNPTITLTDWLLGVTESARFVLSHRSEKSLSDYTFATQSVVLLIGPEGGFSEAEIKLAQRFDFQPVRLGPRVLRTETAALTALSLLQYISGDI